MKKLLSLVLALTLILSLSVTAFAASNAPSVLYIDVAGVTDSAKTIDGVWLWVYANSGTGITNEEMTHVSGTIYSYDISSVTDPLYNVASYVVLYTDNSKSSRCTTTNFESGKNLFTATDNDEGTWSVYSESSTPETPNGPSVTNGDHKVTGKYVSGAESSTIYSVDIGWGSMAFTYTAASKGTWQPDSHSYQGAKPAAWSWGNGANEIFVKNHSNDGITVTPSYTKDSGYENASMTFGNAPLTLTTADNGENGAAGEATKGTITVTPSGSVPEGTSGKIGQITLSIVGTNSSAGGGEATDYTIVSTLEDLTNALASGGNIKLANDITMTSTATITNTVTLNLNNCTLTVAVNGLLVEGGNLTLTNGVVDGKGGVWNQGGIVSIENCTLSEPTNAFYQFPSGTSALKNCTLNGKLVLDEGGTITLSGTITFGSGSGDASYKGISVTRGSTGSVICQFDPTGNIYQGTVTNNGDGTWTVTAAS